METIRPNKKRKDTKLKVQRYTQKGVKEVWILPWLTIYTNSEQNLNSVKGLPKVRYINDFLSVVCLFCTTKHCFRKLLMYIRITYLPMYIVWTTLGIRAHFGQSIRRRSSLLVRRIVDRLARNFTYVHTEDMWHSPHWETQLSTCNQMRMLALPPASQRIVHISWWPSLDFRQLRVSPVSWRKFEFWICLFVSYHRTFHLQSNAHASLVIVANAYYIFCDDKVWT